MLLLTGPAACRGDMPTLARRMRCVLCVSLFAAVLAPAVPARAQVLGDSGQLVRVKLRSGGTRQGRLVRFERDTLELLESDMAGRLIFAYPRTELARTWVSVGHSRRTGRGMGIGLLAGALLGGVYGAATYKPCEGSTGWDCFLAPRSRGASAKIGAALGGSLGVVIGGIVGVAVVRQHWRLVYLPRGTTLGSAGRGLGLAVRLPVQATW